VRVRHGTSLLAMRPCERKKVEQEYSQRANLRQDEFDRDPHFIS